MEAVAGYWKNAAYKVPLSAFDPFIDNAKACNYLVANIYAGTPLRDGAAPMPARVGRLPVFLLCQGFRQTIPNPTPPPPAPGE